MATKQLRAAVFEVKTFTGEPHCFAFNGQTVQPGNAIKAIQDAESFVRRHIRTAPRALDPTLVRRVRLGRFIK